MDLTVISNLSDVIAAVILYGGSLLLLLATLKGFHPFDAGVYGPTMGRRAGITDAGKLTVLDYPIVTSARTAAAFATGQDDAIQLRPR